MKNTSSYRPKAYQVFLGFSASLAMVASGCSLGNSDTETTVTVSALPSKTYSNIDEQTYIQEYVLAELVMLPVTELPPLPDVNSRLESISEPLVDQLALPSFKLPVLPC